MTAKPPIQFRFAIAALALWAVAPSVRADHFSAAWPENAPGIWEQDGVWTTSAYPNNGHTILDSMGNPVPGPNPTYDVLIDTAPPCNLGIHVTVQTVNVFAGSTLNLATNTSIIANTGFGNGGVITLTHNSRIVARTGSNGIALGHAGTITLFATSNPGAELVVGNGSFVNNGGQILMGGFHNSIHALSHGNTFSIEPAGLIRGGGRLNVGYAGGALFLLNFVNRGLIDATGVDQTLDIGLGDNVNANLRNTGTLRASGDGTLRIHAFNTSGIVNNTGGTIDAKDNATVRLESRVTVTGGTLTTSGNGTIRGERSGSAGGTGYGGTFADVVNTGTMAIGPDENFRIAGTFTNNGQVRFDAAANIFTGLLIRGSSVVLAGNGLFAMNGGAGIAGGDAPGQTATVTSGITIRGQGLIGTNNSNFLYKALNLVNQGLIDATGVLSIFVDNSQSSNVNNNGGTLRASGGGLLRLDGPGTVSNAGGTVEALTGSTVRLFNGATLEGGTISTAGTGEFRGGTYGAGIYKNVTNTGTMAIAQEESFGIAGTFTNNGLVRLDGNANTNTALFLRGGDVTLAGNGLIAMNAAAAIAGADTVGQTATINPGVTIRGRGQIGTPNSNFGPTILNVVNQGLVDATGSLTVFVNSSQNSNVANNGGTFRASPSGFLSFNGPGAVANNTGGIIEALANSTVKVEAGASFTNNAGGTIKIDGGSMDAALGLDLNGGQLIGNGTFLGPIRNNGGTVAPGFSPGKITINGNYTQGVNGVLNIEIGGNTPGTGYDQIRVNGTAVLDGTLNITLINGYQPTPGDFFEIIDPNAVSGAFSQINAPGLTMQSNYSAAGITLTVLADADNDGLPDAFEQQYPQANDPAADFDGDGTSNLEEYRAGTNPERAQSLFAITAIRRNGNDIVVGFNAVASKRYRVQASTNLTDGFPIIIATTGQIASDVPLEVTDPGAALEAPLFYRVTVLP